MGKTISRIRHGELDILRLDEDPDLAGYEEDAPVAGRLIVGHSETGAVHVVEASPRAKLLRKRGSDIAYLVLGAEMPLVHEGHRHSTVVLPAGTHRVVTKRQANADETWSQVQD